MCSKEIAEESLKPNKLMRHMNTHKDVASLTDEGSVFFGSALNN